MMVARMWQKYQRQMMVVVVGYVVDVGQRFEGQSYRQILKSQKV
jgi:hypothetical protein